MDLDLATICKIISLPIAGALIGWFTNYLAIKMLFRPLQPVKFLFWELQGVFPRRQALLAQRIGEVVASELFSAADVRAALKARASAPEMALMIEKHVQELLRTKLQQFVPFVMKILNPGLELVVQEVFRKEIGSLVEGVVAEFSADLEKIVDVRDVVASKVRAFPGAKLEAIVLEVMHRELRFIELAGGFLGFMVGLVQALGFLVWDVF